RLPGRTRARTANPSSTRLRATAEPMNPLAPVKRTLEPSVMASFPVAASRPTGNMEPKVPTCAWFLGGRFALHGVAETQIARWTQGGNGGLREGKHQPDLGRAAAGA